MVILATTLLGMAIERTAYKPLRDAPKNSVLISAIGVSFLLENFATYVFSGKPKAFPEITFFSQFISIGGIEVSFPWINLNLNIPVVRVQVITFFIPVVTIIFLAILLYIINHTKLGMSMRAVSKDYETASVMGIDVDRVITSTFAIGSSLAAIGAVMWGVKYPQVQPMMGVMPGLKCFIAAVVGGIGNVPGAVLGGFILGMGEILLVASLPSLTGYRDALAFILLILILLFRPTGILGEKTTEKV